MQNNVENTKEFNVSELEEKSKNTKKTTSKKATSKKRKGSKKLKPMYLVPVIAVAVIAVVLLIVWQISSSDGPVYGERCAGMPEISDTAISSSVDYMKENEKVADTNISINCKTIKIVLTMAEGATQDDAVEASKEVLAKLDETVGLSKSNSESAYSDLVGIANGKTQYHVDFVIKGSSEEFPIFASKHPSKDEINFTFNEARDPELVEKLHEQQAEEEQEEVTEE